MSYETHADLVTKIWKLEKEKAELNAEVERLEHELKCETFKFLETAKKFGSLKDENKMLLKALTKIIVEDCSIEECWDTAITVKAKIRQESIADFIAFIGHLPAGAICF